MSIHRYTCKTRKDLDRPDHRAEEETGSDLDATCAGWVCPKEFHLDGRITSVNMVGAWPGAHASVGSD
jgi:hypothetical protein